jgi:DNA-binding beta-propeller fold protein YncE
MQTPHPLRLLSIGLCVVSAIAHVALAQVSLHPLWTNDAGGLERAEIVVYDFDAKELLVGNGPDRCIMRLDARTGKELGRLDVSRWGDPTSVAASHGLIAVAVVAPRKTDAGHIVLFRRPTGADDQSQLATPVASIRVSALPDMVTFTPDGRYVLSANEGEPNDDYTIDPEGSISVIDVGGGVEHAFALTADFLRFNPDRETLEQQGVRISGPNSRAPDGRATVAQDVEPEYIAVAPDSRTAWVTLQENNALAIVDVRSASVRQIVPLGLEDHSQAGNGFDASDSDGGIHIRRWPVFGMYQPDGIAVFEVGGETYLATGNEGDTRDYAGFSDEARVKDLRLDESLLRDDAKLQADDRLGRLKVSSVGDDTDGDGDVDRLLTFGGRSLALWNADGQLVYNSGDALEHFVAQHFPARFNIDEDGIDKVDARSPVRGPEPEGVVVGRVGASTYAFVGLERTSAVAIFDVTVPAEAQLVDVVPLTLDAKTMGGSHIAPEGMAFVPAERSPTGDPLLAVSCEVTGTTILFRVDSATASDAKR